MRLRKKDKKKLLLDKHRVKIQKGARRCPFNALIVRPVGSKERQLNPKARAAMEKEWQQLRDKEFWDESVVRERDEVAA